MYMFLCKGTGESKNSDYTTPSICYVQGEPVNNIINLCSLMCQVYF